MQFPLSRITIFIFLIFACGTSAWAQSKSAKFADLTIGDFNATMPKRVFTSVDRTLYRTPMHLERPAPYIHLDLTIKDFNAIMSKRIIPRISETHDETPRNFKEPAPSMHLDLGESAEKIRLNFAPKALNSEEPLLSSPLLRNTTRSATSSKSNQSPKNSPPNVFLNQPKLDLRLYGRCNYIKDKAG